MEMKSVVVFEYVMGGVTNSVGLDLNITVESSDLYRWCHDMDLNEK